MAEIVQSEEATVKINGIEITYDTFGDPQAAPMLLIMGLSTQMIMWDEAFCKAIASNGYWVIRFDNRDVGLSTKFDNAGIPDLMEMMMKVQQGEEVKAPYTLLDMAKDAIGLLDVLKIDTAHIVGASMGGMIAQTIAIHYPERVRTLTSIMSTTSNPELPQPGPEAISILITPPPSERAEYIEDSVKTWRFLNGELSFDEDFVRERSTQAFDRCYYPVGAGRQLAAILASGSRKEELKNVKVPTLVIHGDTDPLVPVEGGKETAEVIPEAKLLILEGMGHSIPAEVAPKIIEAIVKHAI
ncbi:MAG: alpha/beta hydrolase [Candidatus Heimdallarchaeota archaeon]|nr:MAG: alpha/beta hydrolase [Candidatus Heimdallarchaeota archaeon]